MSATGEPQAPEQDAWEKLGGPGRFDDLIHALGGVPGIALDVRRRVRLAIALAELARRDLKFFDWRDGANVLLPLVVLSPEARASATEVVRLHWSEKPKDERSGVTTAPKPGIRDWITAIGAPTLLGLLVVALLTAGYFALLRTNQRPVIPPVQPRPPGVPETVGQFWGWLSQFFITDLMFRINAVVIVAACGVVWWRRVRGEQTQRLRRDRRQGRVSAILRLDPPAYLTTAAVRRAGRALRRPTKFEGRRLDVRRTVEATIKAAGFLTLVRRQESRTPDCLMLVDRASRNDQLSSIAEALAKRLRDGGTEVLRYEFQGFPDVLEAVGRRYRGHPVLSIEALARRHAGARVVIVSTGRGFFEPMDRTILRKEPSLYGAPQESPFVPALEAELAGRLKPRVLPAFSGPPILMTPTPVDRWGPAEAALKEAGFAVTSLGSAEDLYAGLNTAAEALANGRPAASLDRRVATYATPGADPLLVLLESPDLSSDFAPVDKEFRERIASGVVDYASARLGEAVEGREPDDIFATDPFVAKAMAGIATLALFPRIEPGLTWELWHVATGHHPSLERLARLARLPWFRKASMPDWLRGDIARCVQRQMAARGEADIWTQLRHKLQDWTHRRLGNDPVGLPVYAPESGHSGWRGIFRLWRERGAPPIRDVVEERLFLTFLETGDIPEEDLSIVLPRADRPTPAMRVTALGFVVAAVALATFAPLLLQQAVHVFSFLTPNASREQSLPWPIILVLVSFLVVAGMNIYVMVRPEGSTVARWKISELAIVVSSVASLLAVTTIIAESRDNNSIIVWIIGLPYVAITLILPDKHPKRHKDISGTFLIASVNVGVLLLFVNSIGFSLFSIPIKHGPVDDYFLMSVMSMMLLTLSTASIATIPLDIGMFGLSFRIASLAIVISLSSIWIIFIPIKSVRGSNSDLVVTLIPILIILLLLSTYCSLIRSWRDPRWTRRAVFIGTAFLTVVISPFNLVARQLPLVASAVGGMAASILAYWFISGRWRRTIGDLRPQGVWADLLAAMAALIATSSWIAIPVLAAVGVAFAGAVAFALSAVIVPLTYPNLDVLIVGSSSAFVLAELGYRFFPVEAMEEERREAEGATPGATIVLLLWSVALLPDKALAWLIKSQFWQDLLGAGVAAQVWPALAWLALPLALHFINKDGSRALGPVLVGLLPFFAPISGDWIALPGGFWPIGLTLILAPWMASPGRLTWLRPRASVSASHGGIFVKMSDAVGRWRLRPWRVAQERIALAGAAIAFVLLLSPEVTMDGDASGSMTNVIDPQPVRAALFFLMGATALVRWPVRAVLVALLAIAYRFGPFFQAPLADTSFRLHAGLNMLDALELWLAYELVPLSRWVRSRHVSSALVFVFFVLVWITSSPWMGEEAAAGNPPVLLALLSVFYGLSQRSALLPLGDDRTSLVAELVLLTAVAWGVEMSVSRLPYSIDLVRESVSSWGFSGKISVFSIAGCVLAFAFACLGQRLAPLMAGDAVKPVAHETQPAVALSA
jgi:hypothetical protein